MAIRMVRQPSKTPNVSNIDDFVPFRYAYGNQNGYVKGKGNEISYTINGANFKINSGRIVLQGVETDIDSNGFNITVDNSPEYRYFTVYYTVNLGTNVVSINSQYSTSTYPTINNGDDLTATTNGIANLVLYRFTAQNSVISNVIKVVQEIAYTGTALSDYDITKGTIETRLTNLGFRDGSISLSSGFTAVYNTITRQGNYCILTLLPNLSVSQIQSMLNGSTITVGSLSTDFIPKYRVSGHGSCVLAEYLIPTNARIRFNIPIRLTIEQNSNSVSISLDFVPNSTTIFQDGYVLSDFGNAIVVGYEANPIT